MDGQRRNRGQQLCATNPDVADVACETMARWITENPDKRIFAVGMNDWLGWCECPECAAADEREGTHAAQVLTLVNRVARTLPGPHHRHAGLLVDGRAAPHDAGAR